MKRKGIRRAVIIASAVLAALIAITVIYMAVCFIRFSAIKETGLPRIDVDTGGEKILSKEEYVPCTVSLSGTDTEYCIDGASAGIRGRGNTTWTSYPKKPYRIKFDEKTSLFGEEKNKSWVLLALYSDFSYSKDRLAFSLADSFGTDSFSPSYNYVELYINGSYNGLYLLTDQVDENKGRADVKEDFSEDSIAVPFLVELDAYAPDEGEEGVDWFSVGGFAYNIKYPEADERYTQAQFDYIKDYIEKVDTLCRTPGVTLSELSEYIDVESFIDFYIVQEIMGQAEINWKSVYMSKTADGMLKMGPVWDFDFSGEGPDMGTERGTYKEKYDGLRSEGNWFAALYNGSTEFRTVLASRWSELKPVALATIEKAEAEAENLSDAALRDRLRWHWFRPFVSYEKSFDKMTDWCNDRILWLDEAFS